ncbi:hypothetical protein [Kitasatospora sp. NPDC057223]|uniref:hypothetical protein n=1 Tax=Kitasatospora sp. NPDC057223 TaxID=3346055 RepID=UPI003633F089
MTLTVNAREVTAVLLADGWHEIQAGTFTVGPLRFVAAALDDPVGVGGALGFRFTTLDGAMISGPLTSALATRSEVARAAERNPLEELAHRLGGEIVTTDGSGSVRFTYAKEQFEIWLGTTKRGDTRWMFGVLGEREGAVDFGIGEKDPVHQVANAAMSELKAGMRPGRAQRADVDSDSTT